MPRVAPRPPSQPILPARSSDARLPDDVVTEQVSRFSALAVVSGGLWGLGLLMDGVVFPRMFGQHTTTATLIIDAGAVLLAVALYAWVKISKQPPTTKTDAGLGLMLLNAAALALIETWATDPTELTLGHLSWISIVILLCAMIMPSTPSRMLVAALVSASLGPIGVWFAHLRGVDVPGPLETFLMYLPTYACAVAAVIPSRMFERLGRSLREARDLGSYELVAKLGEGGMGEVWRARHRFLARPAAIKLVRPEMLGAATGSRARLARHRFEAEAQVTASLNSPHTVRLYDFGVADDGRFYYVMELLDGLDLSAFVARFGPMPPARTAAVLRQVCHSLAEAHARGLVHRDIKPANVFLCRSGLDADVAKVLDFGLVHDIERDPSLDLTQSLAGLEAVVGTPAFMAPETIRAEGPVDHRADLYAIGCVAYFLLTGDYVFPGKTTMQMMLDHVGTRPVPPSRRAAMPVPAGFDAIVLACLEKEPADRPDSAAEVSERLKRLADDGWSDADARAWWDANLPATADAAEPVGAPQV